MNIFCQPNVRPPYLTKKTTDSFIGHLSTSAAQDHNPLNPVSTRALTNPVLIALLRLTLIVSILTRSPACYSGKIASHTNARKNGKPTICEQENLL